MKLTLSRMRLTPEQHERKAQAHLKASRDKSYPATKRMEWRGHAKRFRLLAKRAAETMGVR